MFLLKFSKKSNRSALRKFDFDCDFLKIFDIFAVFMMSSSITLSAKVRSSAVYFLTFYNSLR